MDSGLLDSLTPPLRPSATSPVRVWLLLGKFGGDNAQVRGFGEHLTRRLGWHCEPRLVRFHAAKKVTRDALPDAIDPARSDSLEAPFPDAVVSCSRFYGVVAAWLKQRAAAAGRPMVHVHFGRIAAPMDSFDLLAATAQYGLPPAPNFVPLSLPFVSRDPARIESAVAAWRGHLDRLPRPWTVLLAGGPIPRLDFDAAAADRIAAQAIASARAAGGSLILVASRRTPGAARERIAAAVEAARDLPTWSVGWPAPEPNPYPALLALGDRFVVTCDSASMIADACTSGKPVELVHLPIADFLKRFSSRGLGLSLDARRRRRRRAGMHPDALDRLRDALVARCWMRPWDEMRDFLHGLEAQGLLAADAGDRARRIQAAELDALALRTARLADAAKPAAAPIVDAAPVAAEAA